MTIDEAIVKYNKLANNDRTCHPEEAQQLAEWLEELKALRHEANEWRKAGYSHGYNKAIDEAMDASAKAICIGCGYLEGTKCKYKGGNCGVSKPMLETVMKALEQLKKRSEK